MSFPFSAPAKPADRHHPHSGTGGKPYFFGKLRRTPETVKRGDFYASDDGEWKPCPSDWVGRDVGDFDPTSIVCPGQEE